MIFFSTGATGTPIPLVSNYLQLLTKPNWILYQYHVDFSPEIDSKRLRYALFAQHKEMFGDNSLSTPSRTSKPTGYEANKLKPIAEG